MNDEKHYADLIESIYSAALDPDKWQNVVSTLGQAFPGVPLAIWGQDYRQNVNLGVLSHGIDSHQMARFSDHYASVNPWNEGVSKAPVGELVLGDHLLDRADLLRSEYYNDWLRPQENLTFSAGGVLVNDGGCFLRLSFLLRACDEARLAEPVSAHMQRIVPHVARSFRVSRILAGAERPLAGPAALDPMLDLALESIPTGVFVVDRAGQVVHTNKVAQRLSTDGALVRLQGSGRLKVSGSANVQVEKALFHLNKRDKIPQLGPFIVLGPNGRRGTIHIVPFPENDETRSAKSANPFAFLHAANPLAMILVEQSSKKAAKTGTSDRNLLSRREREVVRWLSAGLRTDRIADELNIATVTVHMHIAAARRKLGADTREQLVALALINGHI